MKLDFEKQGGLVPAIVQDAHTKVVLMLGFMNEEALEKTKVEGKVTFYSRTKKRLWTKGEESGNFLMVKDIKVDCDNDTLLIAALPVGPVCHTLTDTCFNEKNESHLFFLHQLEKTIQDRKQNPSEKSYTTKLFNAGIDRMAQKVGEEAVETVIASKNTDDEKFLGEAADLVYHLMVLLTGKNLSLDHVVETLRQRHK